MAVGERTVRATAGNRTWTLKLYTAVAMLLPPLIGLQALLAGEWMAGDDVMDAHEWNGLLLFGLAITNVQRTRRAGG